MKVCYALAGLCLVACGPTAAEVGDAGMATHVQDDVEMASCRIESGTGQDASSFEGPCVYLPDEDNSFSVAGVNESILLGETVLVTVFVTELPLAQVSGLTTGGINSRWGEARRSDDDPSCWIGDDFTVCAR